MTFEILTQTDAKLTSVTPRTEKHGDDDGSGHPDAGAAEQVELEAGMRDSIAKAGVKPRGRKAAGVH